MRRGSGRPRLRRRSWSAAAPLAAQMRRGSGRPRLRRRSWSAACRVRVVRAARRGEHRRSVPAMLRSARAGRRGGAPFRRRSGVTSGCATGGAAAIGIRSPVAAAIRPTCCRSTTCCRWPRGAARSRRTWLLRAWHTTACATATDQLRRPSRRGSAASTRWARAELVARRALLQAVCGRSRPCEFRRFRRVSWALPARPHDFGAHPRHTIHPCHRSRTHRRAGRRYRRLRLHRIARRQEQRKPLQPHRMDLNGHRRSDAAVQAGVEQVAQCV